MKEYRKFNTGRGYSPEGQVILYSFDVLPDENLFQVYFYDIARTIAGKFTANNSSDETLLTYYDIGNYVNVSFIHGEILLLIEHFKEDVPNYEEWYAHLAQAALRDFSDQENMEEMVEASLKGEDK